MLWMLDGKIIADDNGVPIDCSHCPCQICGKLITQGSYHIVLTVSKYESNDSVWQDESGQEVMIIKEEWGNETEANAIFQATLPADGFIKSNTNNNLWLQQGSQPYGMYYEYDKMYYSGGGSDEYWQKYEAYDVETSYNQGTPVGQGWLILQCNNDTDNIPRLQVYFNNMNDMYYSDNWTSPQPYYDSMNILPNNFVISQFDVNEVTCVKRGDKFILTQATLSRNIDEMRNNGTTHHVLQNSVTAIFTYIPPSSSSSSSI